MKVHFKYGVITFVILLSSLFFIQCSSTMEQPPPDENSYKILFLHHSTGNVIWKGNPGLFDKSPAVPAWFINYNETNKTNYYIEERSFPKNEPYGWANYPFDYYNIWVKNAGDKPFMEEPTLEMLTKDYEMIIFKHCFPVSWMEEDSGNPDINSPVKSLENYKVQYGALKEKMHEFPNTKFLVWTAAALTTMKTTEESANLALEFTNWVRDEWDTNGDNIYLWDLNELQTEGGLYLLDKYARKKSDSHPGKKFAGDVAPLFCDRIIDVIENNGTKTDLTGKRK